MAELAGVMVGNYFLLECLGREGMVETYRARPTTRGGFDVALRIFQPSFPDPGGFRAHFAAEVEKVWRCHHDAIQPLVEFGAGDGLLYCATLLTETPTLAQVLEQQGDRLLPVPLVVHLLTRLCAAIDYAHEQQIVHGNIQPSSILLDDQQRAQLTHFSMTRSHREGDPTAARLEEGNPAYVAPEQAVGMLTPASDIYALGVLLFRLLGGALPYDGESPGDVVMRHVNEPIPFLRALRPDLPEAVELVARVALSKSPEARFATGAALAQALIRAVAAEHMPPEPARRVIVHARRTRFSWTRAISLLTITVMLSGLLGTLYFFSTLPIALQEISGFPFAAGGIGRITHISHDTPGTSTAGPTPTAFPAQGGPAQPEGGAPPQTPVAQGTMPPGVFPTPTAGPTPLPCAPGSLSIDGSPNLAPLLSQMGSAYTRVCPGLSVSVRADGVRLSLPLLARGRVTLVASDLVVKNARGLTDAPFCALLYAVIVSPDVPITNLDSQQLQAIYQGKITNWAQVGGPDEAITVVLHPSSDASAALFRAFVLHGETEHVHGQLAKHALPAQIAQIVAQSRGALSYLPLNAIGASNVGILSINSVAPSLQSLLQGSYSFWSVEHLYAQGHLTPQSQAFLQFIAREPAELALAGALPVGLLPASLLATHRAGSRSN